MAATTFTAHQESRYRKKWTRPIRAKDPSEVEMESLLVSRVSDLFLELGEKYGCWVWNELISKVDGDDARRVSSLVLEAIRGRVSLLSVFNKIEEIEGLKFEEDRAKSGAS